MSEQKWTGGCRWAYGPDDIPEGENYAIIEFEKINVPGDERSRSAPGHGCGPHTESKTECILYENQGEWEKAIHKKATEKYGDPWVPVILRRVGFEIVTKVQVTVEE